jgi:lysophospholipase L1-like esterase
MTRSVLPGYLATFFFFCATIPFLWAQAPIYDTIAIDFGSVPSPPPWKNLANPTDGILTNLPNQNGRPTKYGLWLFDPFSKINTEGTLNPDPAIGFPATATGDSFFGNSAPFEGVTEPSGGIELMNLDRQKTYTVVLFAARQAKDIRETRYVVQGRTTDTLYLKTTANTDKVVTTRLRPSAEGTIRVIASSGPNNKSAAGFYYLGALKLIYAQDVAPKGRALRLTAPVGGEYWQAGKTPAITWQSQNLEQVALEYSTDWGNTWTPIDTVPAASGKYHWTVPNTPAATCRVRISADSLLADVSQDTFTIARDTAAFRMVVLGSSSAAGVGTSNPDSSWVHRFATFLNPNSCYELTNLAKPGYTSYHILPTGTPIPAQVTIPIDTSRNISQALALRPDAIIINMPSNDASYGIPVADQLANFQLVTDTALKTGAQVWITTTQPRKFNDPAKTLLQEIVRDSILCIYGGQALDFWTGLASEDGTILPRYNSGDATHLNDAGHAILFARIVAAGIQPPVMPLFTELALVPATASQGGLAVTFAAAAPGTITIRWENENGQLLQEQQAVVSTVGAQSFSCPVRLPAKGKPNLVCVLTMTDEVGHIFQNRVAWVVR